MNSSVQGSKIIELETDVEHIKLDMVGIRHVIASQEKILEEMKAVLHAQNKTLNDVVQLNKEMLTFQRDLDRLKDIFETRKRETDKKHAEFDSFASKFKGGIMVFTFMLAIVQGLIVSDYTSIKDSVKELKQDIKHELNVLKKDVATPYEFKPKP